MFEHNCCKRMSLFSRAKPQVKFSHTYCFFYLFPKNKTKSFPHQSDSTTCLCNNNRFSFKAPMEQCQKRAYKAFGIICGGISKRSAQNMQGHSATRYCSLYLHVKLFFSATFHSFITYRYVCLLY